MTTSLRNRGLDLTGWTRDHHVYIFVTIFAGSALLFDTATFAAQIGRFIPRFTAQVLPLAVPAALAFGILRYPNGPIGGIARLVRERGARALIAVTALFAGLAAFTTFKSAIPNLVPFYADPAIVALESSLLGSDPWRLLHDALGPRLGSFLLYSYHLPWFAWWTGLYVVVAWLKPSVLRSQYLLSFFLVLVLIGVVAATFGASVGPIFFDRIYGGERFGDLSRALQSVRFGDSVVRYADYLYSLHTEGRAGLGGGISALPSMHCAAVTLNALYMSQVHRLAGTLAWLFAACIYVGSVYTGWHYVVDGLVSLVGVTLIWKGTGSYLRTPQTRTESQLRA